ncbi:MAG: hypothetical protein PHN80_06345 [Hespellia sp.]|nr:hypothetical protein [Hespellia sp.]
MCECKVHELSEDLEHQCVTEDSKVRLYLSAMRSEKKKRRKPTILERAMTVALELFYSMAVSYFVGQWAITYAYKERGYEAIGGEYMLICATFLFCLWSISKFFKYYRR